MFRPFAVLALSVTCVLGCSKNDTTTHGGGGNGEGDPNATYELQFRQPQEGDHFVIKKSRNATATQKTANTTQTQKDEYRYHFNERIHATSQDERLPTKVTRVYAVADRADADGRFQKASHVGKTITIERYKDAYKYSVNGASLPPREQVEISKDFNRGTWNPAKNFPKTPVKVGDEWSLDLSDIAAIGGNSPAKYDKQKSKLTARLTRVYKDRGHQWGTIVVKLRLVIDTKERDGSPLTGTVDTDGALDVVIDGHATAGKMKLTMKGQMEGRDRLGNAVNVTIEGTEEQSIFPVNFGVPAEG